MNESAKTLTFRIMVIVTTPKLSELASKYFEKRNIPIHYKINATGTAPSDILDILTITE